MSSQPSGQTGRIPDAALPPYGLRAAGPEDFAFVQSLYVEGSAPLLKAIGRWDEARILRRFARAYTLGEAQIVRVDGRDAGFLQVVEFSRQLYLRQIHLSAFAQDRGLGAHLIRLLQARGAQAGKPVSLDVMHGNRARGLYERLGFKPIRANLDKTRMIWRPGRSRPNGATPPR